ncbi:hypothetical protein FO519_003615 [Halicephalobus sp. NKZ332]|nr:hypothetical protein FO519_003615 [Halicephalobus sp. NKZ332]
MRCLVIEIFFFLNICRIFGKPIDETNEKSSALVKEFTREFNSTFLSEFKEEFNSTFSDEIKKESDSHVLNNAKEESNSTLFKDSTEGSSSTVLDEIVEQSNSTFSNEVKNESDSVSLNKVKKELSSVLFHEVKEESNSTLFHKVTEKLNSTSHPIPDRHPSTILTVKCGQNQELKECGSACPQTCNLQDSLCEEHCIKDVCQCKEGFVVSSNGTCILPSECVLNKPKTCHENSHLEACGSPCSPSCQNPTPTVCSLQCIVDACVCNEGFVLDGTRCVKLEDCPKVNKICGENEKFYPCGTHCEPSCEDPFPGFCSDKCLENACQCHTGFVRSPEGKCLPLSECLI